MYIALVSIDLKSQATRRALILGGMNNNCSLFIRRWDKGHLEEYYCGPLYYRHKPVSKCDIERIYKGVPEDFRLWGGRLSNVYRVTT